MHKILISILCRCCLSLYMVVVTIICLLGAWMDRGYEISTTLVEIKTAIVKVSACPKGAPCGYLSQLDELT
jgi:uncharacterized membrane protein